MAPVTLSWGDDRPVSLDFIERPSVLGRKGVGLVQIFTATEQRGRTSQGYVRSAVGERLRYVTHAESASPRGPTLTVTQHDALSRLSVHTSLTRDDGVKAVRIVSEVENTGAVPVILTAVSTATVGFGRAAEDDLDELLLAQADSEWLAENRWREGPIREVLPKLNLTLHGQDGRGRYAITSHGAWATGEHLPAGIITDPATEQAFAWQIETSGAWHWELSQAREGGVLSLLGPTDLEHQFAVELQPGERFHTVPVVLAASESGRDGAVAELTRYRRRLRDPQESGRSLPVVYNDFMNTLMGQPSTEALLPLIDAAADAGAEVFCIDAGWFADPALGDWWATVGNWREAPGRFSSGLASLIDHIHDRGMRSGIWLEPEVVGVHSPAAKRLPDEAYFQRFGHRVVEHDRHQLDFRHPAARAHADAAIDQVIAEFGVSFLKLDYNINPGVGTEREACRAGSGLLDHTRAVLDWMQALRDRHPDVLIENCSSGAMRADTSLLSITHMQSTSDQQDFRLYPPIAASAPATIPPEQCGNWAYPDVDMTLEETAFTLVTGLSGRLYLSGFLDRLRDEQRDLVHAAVETHMGLRHELDSAEPSWPLGLPRWDDPAVCLGLRCPSRTLLFMWDRRAEASHIDVPGVAGTPVELFPARLTPWTTSVDTGGVRFVTIPGYTARVFEVADNDLRHALA